MTAKSTDIATGTVFQYRRVGTFRIVSRAVDAMSAEAAAQFGAKGWYNAEPVKAPKSYRDKAALRGGTLTLWVEPSDAV